jgi:hypothetical protein
MNDRSRFSLVAIQTSDIRCTPSTLFSGISPQQTFYLFSKVKPTLKGRRFQTREEIKENVIRELCSIAVSAFQETFQQLKKRWERGIASRGDYFEGESAYDAVKQAINSSWQKFSFLNTPCTSLCDTVF